LPILGICYGIQRMTVDSGGEVARGPEREYGKSPSHILEHKVPEASAGQRSACTVCAFCRHSLKKKKLQSSSLKVYLSQ